MVSSRGFSEPVYGLVTPICDTLASLSARLPAKYRPRLVLATTVKKFITGEKVSIFDMPGLRSLPMQSDQWKICKKSRRVVEPRSVWSVVSLKLWWNTWCRILE